MVFWVRTPKPKKISSLAPGLVKESIPRILSSYQDKTYDDPPPCPRCGSEERKRHGARRRIYAAIILRDRYRKIYVQVKRYVCRACGRVYRSRSPFYPGCLYGSLVVDTCLFLASSNPFCRVEAILQQWGLQIDRDTVRVYVRRFGRRARAMASIRINGVSVGVNLVRLLFDTADVAELGARLPEEVFQDVGDETYPAVKGARKRLREENVERALRGEGEKAYPESHTLACVYEALHKFFASLLVTPTPFNSMLAQALRRPAQGCVGPVRDGSRCYGDPHTHIDCVNHKARRLIARDKEYRRLRREAEDREQLQEYAVRYYGNVRRDEAVRAAEAYPELVDGEGRFVGVLSTNSMEGGNWRIKSGLRTLYIDPASLEARTILLAIADSTKTYSGGRPCESFAHRHGSFKYSSIMVSRDRDRDTDTDPSSGRDDDSSHHATRHTHHTQGFISWLNKAVQRAEQKRTETSSDPTATN